MRVMKKTFSFTCAQCGEEHEGAPSVAFNSPHYYFQSPGAEQDDTTWVNDDFCIIEGRDRFIRCTLEIPIQGSDEGFLWGVWLSVSEINFENYRKHFMDDGYRARYVGWISNVLPCYPNTLEVVGAAVLQPSNQRPVIELEPTDHPLYDDYRNSVSWERAIDIVQVALHGHNA
jgi:hypothetical protein